MYGNNMCYCNFYFIAKKFAWKLIKGNIDDSCHIQSGKFVESLIEIHNSINKCMAF